MSGVLRNCDRFDGYLDAVKAFKEERPDVEATIENVLYWLFQPTSKEARRLKRMTKEIKDLSNSELGAIMGRVK